MCSILRYPMPTTQPPLSDVLGLLLRDKQAASEQARTLQNQLAASERIAMLAQGLALVHFAYEGYGSVALPLVGELKRIYEQQAQYAVRCCSDVDRQCAISRAENYGVLAFPKLMETLRSCDTTPAAWERAIEAFVRQVIEVHRAALMHGPALSALENSALGEDLDA